MNQTAVALGLHGTHFASPHGLSDPATYSTVSDLSVLATRFIRDYPELYRTYDSAKQFTYNNITQSNRNRLLWLDPSVDGLKTGHTDAAGYCLVATAPPAQWRRPASPDHGGGGRGIGKTAHQGSRELLEWGFQGFNTVKLYARASPWPCPKSGKARPTA